MLEALPIRRSARLVILDPGGHLFLFRYHDEHRDPFWATAGGELKAREDYYTAAARELHEETGFEAPIGPLVRECDAVFAVARSQPARWLERYYLVPCASQAAPSRIGWTEEERATITSWRWWSYEEMLQENTLLFRPAWLPELLATLRG